ncbi:hypothetical protein SETIT_7G324100v2, partial [Setaria italica]
SPPPSALAPLPLLPPPPVPPPRPIPVRRRRAPPPARHHRRRRGPGRGRGGRALRQRLGILLPQPRQPPPPPLPPPPLPQQHHLRPAAAGRLPPPRPLRHAPQRRVPPRRLPRLPPLLPPRAPSPPGRRCRRRHGRTRGPTRPPAALPHLRRRGEQRHPPRLRPGRADRRARPRHPPQQRPRRGIRRRRRHQDLHLLRQLQHPPLLRRPLCNHHPRLLLPPLRPHGPHGHVRLPAGAPPRRAHLQRHRHAGVPVPAARHRRAPRRAVRAHRQVLLDAAARLHDWGAAGQLDAEARREVLPLLLGAAGGGDGPGGLRRGEPVRVREGGGSQAPLPHQPEEGARPARLRGRVPVLPRPPGAAGGCAIPRRGTGLQDAASEALLVTGEVSNL